MSVGKRSCSQRVEPSVAGGLGSPLPHASSQKAPKRQKVQQRKGHAQSGARRKLLNGVKLIEHWPLLARIDRRFKLLPSGHHDEPILRCVLTEIREAGKGPNEAIQREVQYYYSDKSQDLPEGFMGRQTGRNCIQQLTTATRNFLFHDIYDDRDIENAFPVILLQVFQKLNIKCEGLASYVRDRKTMFSEIMRTHPRLRRKDVKEAFIVALHCGSYLQKTDSVKVDALDHFTADLRGAAAALCRTPEYIPLYEVAKARKEHEHGSIMGSFISTVCQNIEHKLWKALAEYVASIKGVVGANMYDGLMDKKGHPGVTFVPADASDYLFKQTDFRVVIVTKPMTYDPATDSARIRSDALQLGPTDRLLLFDLNGTLANRKGQGSRFWRFRPGVKVVGALQRAGWKVGIFTNQHRKNIPLAKLAVAAGLCKFDVVLSGEDCYKPSGRYKHANKGLNEYDRLKSLRTHFGEDRLPRLMLFDDTPAKVPAEDRGRVVPIKTWDNNDTDSHLMDALNRILALGGKRAAVALADPSACLSPVAGGGAGNANLNLPPDEEIEPEVPWRDSTDSSRQLQLSVKELEEAGVITIRPEDMRTYTAANGQEKKCMHPIEFKDGVKMVLIGAGMGVGKSHTSKDQIADFIKRFDELCCNGYVNGHCSCNTENCCPTVVVVTMRQQQAHSLGGELNRMAAERGTPEFTVYLDDDVAKNRHFKGVNFLIVQYESLHRLSSVTAFKSACFVLLDEVRGILGQAVSPTNDKNMCINALAFRVLVMRAKRVLAMDADLDRVVLDWVQRMWPNKAERQIIRYTYTSLARRMIVLDSETDFYRCLNNDVMKLDGNDPSKKVGIIFRTKSDADTWMLAQTSRLVMRVQCMYIHGDTTVDDMKQFRDINKALEPISVFLFTSKLSSAADILLIFARLYLHCSTCDVGFGPNARIIHQMIGRFRNLFCTDVVVYLPHRRETPEATWDSIQTRLETQKTARATALRQFRVIFEAGVLEFEYSDAWKMFLATHVKPGEPLPQSDFKWSETWLLNLVLLHELEQNESFWDGFQRLSKAKGYEIVVDPKCAPYFDPTKRDPLAEAMKDARTGRRMERDAAFELAIGLLKDRPQAVLLSLRNSIEKLKRRGLAVNDNELSIEFGAAISIHTKNWTLQGARLDGDCDLVAQIADMMWNVVMQRSSEDRAATFRQGLQKLVPLTGQSTNLLHEHANEDGTYSHYVCRDQHDQEPCTRGPIQQAFDAGTSYIDDMFRAVNGLGGISHVQPLLNALVCVPNPVDRKSLDRTSVSSLVKNNTTIRVAKIINSPEFQPTEFQFQDMMRMTNGRMPERAKQWHATYTAIDAFLRTPDRFDTGGVNTSDSFVVLADGWPMWKTDTPSPELLTELTGLEEKITVYKTITGSYDGKPNNITARVNRLLKILGRALKSKSKRVDGGVDIKVWRIENLPEISVWLPKFAVPFQRCFDAVEVGAVIANRLESRENLKLD